MLRVRAHNIFSEVHAGGATLTSAGDLLGANPPLLVDFLNATFSIAVAQRSFRKAIRIHAEEFAVNL